MSLLEDGGPERAYSMDEHSYPGISPERSRDASRIYLERSKACPVFLTWFTESEQFHIDVLGVIEDLIIPEAERW